MTIPRIDIGRMTAEECAIVIKELWVALTEEQMYELINEVLTEEQKSECALSWAEEE